MRSHALSVVRMMYVLFGCSGTVEEPAELEQTADSATINVGRATMPDFPMASDGQLAIITASRLDQYVVDGSWDARVDRCEMAGISQILAQTDGYAVAVLLPSRTQGSLSLPVEAVNDSMLPEQSVRVVVQIYPEDRAYVLEAIDGTAEVNIMASTMSGRFSVTFEEGTYRDTVLGAGSFQALPIQVVSEAYCRPYLAPRDTANDDEPEPTGRLQ